MPERIVVVPTDLSDESLQAISTARQVFGDTNLSVHLVYVVQPTPPIVMPSGYMPIDWVGDGGRALQGLLSTLDFVPSVSAVREGHAATEIVRYAEAVHAQAIAMMSHGREGIERLLMGSTAEEVMRTSNLPVLIARPLSTDTPTKEQPVASVPKSRTFTEWLGRVLGHHAPGTVELPVAFGISLEMEARARDLYRAFARRFAEDVSAAKFFAELSADEDRHYNAVLFARNILREVPPTADRVEMNVERMEKLAALVDRTVEKIEQPEFTLDEATRITEEIEMSEIDQIMETLTHLPSHPVILRVLDDLKRGTGEHAERLIGFLIERRNPKH